MFSHVGGSAYKPGLERSLALAEIYGNPHHKFKSVHVAGTNGKGSTSHLIASVLQSQGYKVGLFTSPHLVDFRERIRINGEMIPREWVKSFVEEWVGKDPALLPSFYEISMIMAFKWFAEEKVDYAVIEVGMGGRMDSTNIINPLLSVITNISDDHTQFLGDTLPKIAAEKAGIIKKGVPVVVGETQKETESIFRQKASTTHSDITFADGEWTDLRMKETDDGWLCETADMKFILPLGGDYQKKNIQTVLSALKRLKKAGVNIEKKNIEEGIKKVVTQTGLCGRWTVMADKPLTIADTGHNPAGLLYNFTQLERKLQKNPDSKLRVIMGFVADKAVDKIISFLPKDAVYYLTNAEIPRALPANELQNKFKAGGIESRIYKNVSEAFAQAKKEASDQDIIFIGGSTFIVADFLRCLGPYVGHGSWTDCC